VKLVLDTNIYCDYAEGLPHAVDILATRGDDIYLPSIVLGELTYGFLKGSLQQFNERKLQEIINKLKIEIVDVNQNVSRKYAIIYLSACCMEVGGTLVTRDRHFQHIEQIETLVLKP
jgi:predicted nucleic acid-binding protein